MEHAFPEVVGDKLDPQTHDVHQDRDQQLGAELHLSRQVFQIVHHAEDIDQSSADEHRQNLLVLSRENDQRNHRSDKDRHAAEPWHGLGMHPPGVLGNVHGADLRRQPDGDRRKGQGQQKRHAEGGQ